MSTREDREADAAADCALGPEEDGPLIRLVRTPAWSSPLSGQSYPAHEHVEIGYRQEGVEDWGVLELSVTELRGLVADAQSVLAGRGPVVYR